MLVKWSSMFSFRCAHTYLNDYCTFPIWLKWFKIMWKMDIQRKTSFFRIWTHIYDVLLLVHIQFLALLHPFYDSYSIYVIFIWHDDSSFRMYVNHVRWLIVNNDCVQLFMFAQKLIAVNLHIVRRVIFGPFLLWFFSPHAILCICMRYFLDLFKCLPLVYMHSTIRICSSFMYTSAKWDLNYTVCS